MRRTALLLVLLLPHLALAAGTIEATVDKQKVTVGEPFVYTVNVLLPQGAQADLPSDKAKFKGLEIRNYQPAQTPQADGSQQLVLRYTLVCFDTGLAGVKDFRIPVKMPNGATEKWLAPPVEVTIASVLPEKGEVQPKGFIGPMMLPSSWTQWLWAGLIALLIIAAVVGAIIFFRRRKRTRPTIELEKILSPDEAAVAALHRLREDDLVATGDFLVFYQRFDEILRAWLQARFDVPALERTTRGIMFLLRVRRGTDDWRKDYLQLLYTGDRVKFANLPPTDAEAYDHLEQAERVIAAAAEAVRAAEGTNEAGAPAGPAGAAGGDAA